MALESGPTAVEIVPVSPDDAEEILTILHRTWRATYPNEKYGITAEDIDARFEGKEAPEEISKRKEDLRTLPPTVGYFTAKIDGRTVGLCRVEKEEGRNQLRAIYVLPEFQGQGIGRKLWERAEAFLDHSKDTYVEVAEYNERAIAFYQTLGFSETGRRLQDERFRLKNGAIIPEIEMCKKAIQ